MSMKLGVLVADGRLVPTGEWSLRWLAPLLRSLTLTEGEVLQTTVADHRSSRLEDVVYEESGEGQAFILQLYHLEM